MEDPVEEVVLTGFDAEGEPSVRRIATGRLWLGFQFMPPSWAPDEDREELGPWADFDKQLAQAIGTPVVWEDREWFRIDRPGADTIPAIQQFLTTMRRLERAGS